MDFIPPILLSVKQRAEPSIGAVDPAVALGRNVLDELEAKRASMSALNQNFWDTLGSLYTGRGVGSTAPKAVKLPSEVLAPSVTSEGLYTKAFPVPKATKISEGLSVSGKLPTPPTKEQVEILENPSSVLPKFPINWKNTGGDPRVTSALERALAKRVEEEKKALIEQGNPDFMAESRAIGHSRGNIENNLVATKGLLEEYVTPIKNWKKLPPEELMNKIEDMGMHIDQLRGMTRDAIIKDKSAQVGEIALDTAMRQFQGNPAGLYYKARAGVMRDQPIGPSKIDTISPFKDPYGKLEELVRQGDPQAEKILGRLEQMTPSEQFFRIKSAMEKYGLSPEQIAEYQRYNKARSLNKFYKGEYNG